MRLLEVKNNLIKLTYSEEESPVLGRFLALMTDNKCYVAQFINLKTDNTYHFAVARLLFTFTREGVVDNYDGSIPDIKSDVTFLPTSELLDLLPMETPVKIGKIAQQSDILSLDISVFENNLTVFSDQVANVFTFISNCARQLFQMREKVVIIDTDDVFENYPKFKLGRDFKLPLNADMINYLIENEMEDTDLQAKAVIQDVLYEIQNYVKSIIPEFIPIDTLINVIAAQFKETKMPELALLKNRLIKFRQTNIFANSEKEFSVLKRKLKNKECVIIDISDIAGAFQRDVITYIHKKLNSIEKYIYLFITLNNGNSNKKLLKRLTNNNHIFTTILVNHNYKYVKELKAVSQNVVIFQPQTEQNEFGVYRAFLEKLNMQECIVIGKLTQKVPFIADCSNLDLGLTTEDVFGEEIQFIPKEDNSQRQDVQTPTNQKNMDFVTRNEAYKNSQNQQMQEVTNKNGTQQIKETPEVENNIELELPNSQLETQNIVEEQISRELNNSNDINENSNKIQLDTSIVDAIPDNFQTNNSVTELDMPSDVETSMGMTEEEPDTRFAQVTPEIESMIKQELEKDETHTATPQVMEEPSAQDTIEENADLGDLSVGLSDDLGLDMPTGEMEDASLLGLDDGFLDGLEDALIKEEQTEPANNLSEIAQESTQTATLQQEDLPISTEPVNEPKAVEISQDGSLDDLSGLVAETEQGNDLSDMPGLAEDNSSELGLGDLAADDLFGGGDMSDMSLGGDLTEADLDFIEETQDIPLGLDSQDNAGDFGLEDELPVYPAEEGEEVESNVGFTKGDTVTHPKYGTGVIEKIIKYGNKTLCSILFEDVGRRLLDPSVSDFSKING